MIYSGFIDKTFSEHFTGNRSGGEEMYSKIFDDDNDGDDEFCTPKETPRDIMPDLESEESAEQRRKQKGQGLKILTPQQMLSGLLV